jgi:hypothetical protein
VAKTIFTRALIGVSQMDDCVGATRNLSFTSGELSQIESILSQ